jgi:hypothetical protein
MEWTHRWLGTKWNTNAALQGGTEGQVRASGPVSAVLSEGRQTSTHTINATVSSWDPEAPQEREPRVFPVESEMSSEVASEQRF